MLSEYSVKMKHKYNISDHLKTDKEIQLKMNCIIEANYNKIQERELVRAWVWFYDKLWYLQKWLRYLPFERKYLFPNKKD